MQRLWREQRGDQLIGFDRSEFVLAADDLPFQNLPDEERISGGGICAINRWISLARLWQ
jgi:hypothetical protein